MPKITTEAFKGSPIETEYKNLSPTPDKFADFVNHLKAAAVKPYDFGADKFKATKTPMFFIFGDADGVRLAVFAQLLRPRLRRACDASSWNMRRRCTLLSMRKRCPAGWTCPCQR